MRAGCPKVSYRQPVRLLRMNEGMVKAYYWNLEEPDFLTEEELTKSVWEDRRQKAAGYARQADRVRCLAAGVLLQYALAEWESERQKGKQMRISGAEEKTGTDKEPFWYPVTAGEIRRKICNAGEGGHFREKIIFGQAGKPYFENPEAPFFNLSHSGSYVLCATADCEIGADIQEMRAADFTKAAEYAFCKEESDWVKQDLHRFYQLWTGKEAYGKMTGEGLKAGLRQNLLEERVRKRQDVEMAGIVLGKGAAQDLKTERLYAGALCWRKGK